MSGKTIFKLLLGFTAILLLTPFAHAENNQTVIIGFDVGSYTFSDSNFNDVENAVYGSEFLEWYLFDEIGIGIRSHKFAQSDTSNTDEKLTLIIMNLTLNWVFLGSNDDLRMALYAGYGPGCVEYSDEVTQSDVSETANTRSMGFFIDWGEGILGIRLGYNSVSAEFEYEEGNSSGTVDGSGSSISFGVRLSL